MRKSRFSIEQIVAALRQVETGVPVANVIRRLGISKQTFYRWKKIYGEPQPAPRESGAARAEGMGETGSTALPTPRVPLPPC